MMKKFTLFICFLGVFMRSLQAQQEQQYTQFMYSKLTFNPAYAGGDDLLCLMGVLRQQWIGLEGAPQTQWLSFSTPMLGKHLGFGLTLTRNTIGVERRMTADMAYSYRVKIGENTLSFGLQASLRNRSINFSDPRIRSTQDPNTDPALFLDTRYRTVPNFGVGIYYQQNNFYAGISAPRLVGTNIDFSDKVTVLNKEVNHVYLMTGATFSAGKDMKIQPQALVKYAQNAPFSVDINCSAMFRDKYVLGATYRLGSGQNTTSESVDILLGMQINRRLLFAVSYDVNLSQLRAYNSGSIEGMLRYCFAPAEGKEYINPRFF